MSPPVFDFTKALFGLHVDQDAAVVAGSPVRRPVQSPDLGTFCEHV